MRNKLVELLRGVYCVSLPTDSERRENATLELTAFGIEDWKWHDGVFAASPEVRKAILGGEVQFSPPCFRCGKEECSCENNFLTFPQIAVCLAYRNLWKRILAEARDESDLFLLCEDDVAFTTRAREGADRLADAITRGELIRTRPLLVRLGWARGKEHESREAFVLEADRVRMSNPCYLLNAAMAARLLDAHEKITHTVDVFTHREENKKGGHYTLHPPLAYEHSWSTGRFESAIFPRKTRSNYLWKNASWGARIRMLLKGAPRELASGVRKRYEIRPGLLVLDATADTGLAEVSKGLPAGIGLAVWSEESGWLAGSDELGLTLPEWGVWYERIAVSSSIAARIAGRAGDVRVVKKENLLNLDWGATMTELPISDRLWRNAAALLHLEIDSVKPPLTAGPASITSAE